MTSKKAWLTVLLICTSLMASAQCTSITISRLTSTLKALIEPTISIKLDRDDSRLSLLGQTQRFKIPHEDISKAAHDWRYWVQDIRSDDSNLWYDKQKLNFALDVRFEGEGSEIKGVCPGCLVGNNDNRAPDINWKGGRIARIRFKPMAFENSVTIQVISVELFGEFDLNGFLESIFPRMVRKMEAKIKRDIQSQATTILNRTDIRRSIANQLRPILRSQGISNIRTVRCSRDGRNMEFCR